MQTHDDHAPPPTTALQHLEAFRSVHIKDGDVGGMGEEVAPVVAKYDAREGCVQRRDTYSSKEEVEEKEKTFPVYVAKRDAAHDELHVEGEEEVDVEEEEAEKRRPGRPKKKPTHGDVEEEAKAQNRVRLKAGKKEAASFAADRPTRERKSIDRFIASAERDKSKELQIKQGGGTPLKDIPNVVYKLSKRSRHDEALSQLHSVLFNKRGKAVVLKQNILQFSGYVWVENQVKERAKVQEKLERYTKESLMQFIDLLNVHVSRTLKKEDLVAKVLSFLEKPHRTTDTLLELKEQERKNSGKRSSSRKGPSRSKILRVEDKSSKSRTRKNATGDACSDGSEKFSDSESLEEEIEQKCLNFKDDTDHAEETIVEETKQANDSSTVVKQDIEENLAEEGDREDNEGCTNPRKKPKVGASDVTLKIPSKSNDRFYSKKKSNEDHINWETSVTPFRKGFGRPIKSLQTSGKKAASTSKDKGTGKNVIVKGSIVKRKVVPSDGELQAKIRELLREADFSKVTFTDVVSQLEGIFGVSLIEQKGHVKGLIRDEISNLTEADDEPEDELAAVEVAKIEKDEDKQTCGIGMLNDI